MYLEHTFDLLLISLKALQKTMKMHIKCKHLQIGPLQYSENPRGGL